MPTMPTLVLPIVIPTPTLPDIPSLPTLPELPTLQIPDIIIEISDSIV
jgi:hypothetical protein